MSCVKCYLCSIMEKLNNTATPVKPLPEKWKKIVLTKPKSPYRVEIAPDLSLDPEGWFIRFSYLKKNGTESDRSNLIIRKDAQNFYDFICRVEGWREDLTQRII